jgi:hypothetical protein
VSRSECGRGEGSGGEEREGKEMDGCPHTDSRNNRDGDSRNNRDGDGRNNRDGMSEGRWPISSISETRIIWNITMMLQRCSAYKKQ